MLIKAENLVKGDLIILKSTAHLVHEVNQGAAIVVNTSAGIIRYGSEDIVVVAR